MPVIATCTCGRTWSGLDQCHCSICHAHFSTVVNFDLHKPGPRRPDGTPSCGSEHRGGKQVDPSDLTRMKRDGSVVPVLKLSSTSMGPIWVGWTPDAPTADTWEKK